MQTAIVTVMERNENRERDLEIPVQMNAGQVAHLLAQALGLVNGAQAEFRLQATVPGGQPRDLGPEERLNEAGVWDGSYLELVAVSSESAERKSRTPDTKRDDWPVEGWKPLDVAPAPESEEPPPHQDGSGYVWRRIDV